MKTILVPIDGSKAAERALEVALDLAVQRKAQVKLLHVLLRDKEPEELLRLPNLLLTGRDLTDELKRLAQRPLKERSAAEMMADPGAPNRPVPAAILHQIGTHLLKHASASAVGRHVPIEALKVADGPVAPTITATALAVQAETIVMGSRGLRLIEALGFGSTSLEVCQSAHCTCIAVH